MKAWIVTDYPGHPFWENKSLSFVEPKFQENRSIEEVEYFTDSKHLAQRKRDFEAGYNCGKERAYWVEMYDDDFNDYLKSEGEV